MSRSTSHPVDGRQINFSPAFVLVSDIRWFFGQDYRNPMEDDDGHFCGWCGGDWLPDGQPCPAISLGHEPAGDEAGELREYYVTFLAG